MGCLKLTYKRNNATLKVAYSLYRENQKKCAGDYRYGFNGKEKDDETSTQDYGLRIYDTRLGRFLSVDPLFKDFAWNSTYCFAENSPIKYIDLDGGEKKKNSADCWDGDSEKNGGMRIFRNIQIPKIKLITHEYTREKTVISSTSVPLSNPTINGSLDQTVNIGNTTAQVAVTYNMRIEPDALTIDNAGNGNNIVSTGPVSGQGTAAIPRGVPSVRIRVNPQDPNGTSVYNVNLQFNDERVFVEKKTKFLGITINRKTYMESAKESSRNIQKRNNDDSSTNDINDGTDVKDLYEKQHGPVNAGSTGGGGSLQ